MAHHGNTPAAWTGVMIILVGFVVGGNPEEQRSVLGLGTAQRNLSAAIVVQRQALGRQLVWPWQLQLDILP